MNDKRSPVVGISMGDYNGVSPEVIIKALARMSAGDATYVIVGAGTIVKQMNAMLGYPLQIHTIESWHGDDVKPGIFVLDIFENRAFTPKYGTIDRYAGEAAGKSLAHAVTLACNGMINAIVTGPVSKKALVLAGYDFPGQTEFLAAQTGTDHVVMMLVSGEIRVALATTHCAIADVPGKLTVDGLMHTMRIINNSLVNHFNIKSPKIAVCGLNPHSGDSGLFGNEEQEIIQPAIELARAEKIDVTGPFPADTLFARAGHYDAYLAMYHDQGLIPFKIKAFGKGVNYTAGLPVIRTSPDHGTAFDIAGKNCADEQSMMEAIKLATALAQNQTTRSSL